jgi:hypothetical protein
MKADIALGIYLLFLCDSVCSRRDVQRLQLRIVDG